MGESYMDGDYEVDDLGAMLAVVTANANNIEVRAGGRRQWQSWRWGHEHACVTNLLPRINENTRPARRTQNDLARAFDCQQSSRGLLGAFNWLGDRLLAAAHAARSNTLEGSRRNIEEHYDAGGRSAAPQQPLQLEAL